MTPFLSFGLPSLANGVEIAHITCRAEPSPIANTSVLNKRKRAQDRAAAGMSETDPFAPKRGFLANADEAICIFQLRFTGGPVILIQGGLNVHFGMGHSYTVFIHRRTFLDLIQNYEAELNSGITPQKGIGQDGFSQAESITRMAWAQWGPLVSRWFSTDIMFNRWITNSAGQRCAVVYDDGGPHGRPIMVIDFNPYVVRKMKTKMRRAIEAANKAKCKHPEVTTGIAEEESSELMDTTEYLERTADEALALDPFADDDTNVIFGSPTPTEDANMDVDDNDSWFTVDSDDENDADDHIGDKAQVHYNIDGYPYLAFCRLLDGPFSVDTSGTFTEEVAGYLPCVTYVSETRYNDYDGVLLDEERIIGIKVNLFYLNWKPMLTCLV